MALCGAIKKMALFRVTTKTKSWSLFALIIFCHCFVHGNNIYLVDFQDTHSKAINNIIQ